MTTQAQVFEATQTTSPVENSQQPTVKSLQPKDDSIIWRIKGRIKQALNRLRGKI